VFGKTIEMFLRQQRYLLLYLVAGVFCGIVHIFNASKLKVALIGANGAITSILGAYIIHFPKTKIYYFSPLIVVFIPVQVLDFLY
jgi:membrane associated rhomboid family serine protease